MVYKEFEWERKVINNDKDLSVLLQPICYLMLSHPPEKDFPSHILNFLSSQLPAWHAEVLHLMVFSDLSF